jgi:Na+/H+-dicarboxylate symporter
MLQVIVFSLLLGIAINIAGEAGSRVASFFVDLNAVFMKFIMMLMQLAPYGVFCLIAVLFVNQGLDLVLGVLNYFLVVLFVLLLHAVVVYGFLLHAHQLSPKVFFSKIYVMALFAFGVSSSNISIPVALDTVERKLGVGKAVSSFVVPLGVNMNKNGTAIMQAVAAIFIAHAYHIELGLAGTLLLFVMIIFSSIGTAGVPSMGIVTLVMVLKQLGLPTEGIALIIGVDRLLDMARTSVNVVGNAVVACLVAKSEKHLDYSVFRAKE